MRTSRVAVMIAFLSVVLVEQRSEADDPVIIQSPLEGAIVPPHFEVSVTFGEVTSCDTSTECYQGPASGLMLNVDDGLVESCIGCCCATSFSIILVPGPHRLQAAAAFGAGTAWSEYVNIVVKMRTDKLHLLEGAAPERPMHKMRAVRLRRQVV